MIVGEWRGKFPRTYQELKQLKGIGDYTAAAIASFAFGERVAVLDGNVFRVLARVFALHDDIASSLGKKKFRDLANSLVPAEDPATYNQSIMEFGALLCTPKNPGCEKCPLASGCQARHRGMQADLPVKRKSAPARHRHFYYLVVRRGNSLLMNQRVESDIWRGLWDFPLWEPGAFASEQSIRRRIRSWMGDQATAVTSREYRHILSHQVLHARFIEVKLGSGKPWPTGKPFSTAKACSLRKIKQLPKPILVTRFLQELGLEG
jgi:A/G-specific adenine glycosylase